MHARVFVEQIDGTGRIDLTDGDNTDAAADMVYGLTAGASGKGFLVGIELTPSTEPPAGAAAPQRQQEQQHATRTARGAERR